MAPEDSGDEASKTRPGTAEDCGVVAAERVLRSLQAHGVERVFANLGTDHAPLLECAVRLRDSDQGEDLPSFVICPHEFAAMSAAHGYAATTGEPQAVLVHVDVGTQNLGAAMHNAHRSAVPVLVIAGLAPVTDDGFVGSRNNVVQYIQDVFDQAGIVREYCRWTGQFQPPEDPDGLITRALERATDTPCGPVYLSATREALETPIRQTSDSPQAVRSIDRPGANEVVVDRLVAAIEAADRPLLVTSGVSTDDVPANLDTLVEFAETGGIGVVEHAPTRLCFPRDHDLHVGFDPARCLDDADLVLAVDVDIPWVPWQGQPAADATTIQIDTTPTKSSYPRWSFQFTETIAADPITTLATATDRLDPAAGESARAAWRAVHQAQRERAREVVETHREAHRLTPELLSATVAEVVDDETVLVNDATTSGGTVLEHVPLATPGSYLACWGAGLGWGTSAAIGVKLARPNRRVVALVGDGSYVFSNPTACAWLAEAHTAPTVTVIYNNAGWNAVRLSTMSQHPSGAVAREGLPESSFEPRLALSQPAKVVDAHTATVGAVDELRPGLEAAMSAVEDGRSAVLDVQLEPV